MGVRTAMESLTFRQYEVIDDHNKGFDFFSSFHLFFHHPREYGHGISSSARFDGSRHTAKMKGYTLNFEGNLRLKK